jgi:hypothetical protein
MPHSSDNSTSQLWEGCILATIAHAIFIAQQPELAHEQSWDGLNYNIQDSQGALGTITFSDEGTVGAFFDSHSSRNPFTSGCATDLDERFAGMPSALRALAERETLQYLLQDFHGNNVSLLTAAFWSEKTRLVAAEPWPDVISNGAHLIQFQLRPVHEAIVAWQSHYEFNATKVELLRSVYERKISAGKEPMALTDTEKEILREGSSPGLQLSRDLLAEVSIAA